MASLLDYFKKTPKTEDPKETKIIFESIGTSGTEIFSGYIQEEYLRELSDSQAADVYDKMRRSDTQIKMVLSAVKNPIKKANWYIEPSSDKASAKYLSDFVHFNLMEDLGKPWRKTLHEALSMVDFGFSLFEVTHKVVRDEKTFGTYIGLQDLGWRSPRTIEKWNVDKCGILQTVTQQAYGDLEAEVDIPAKFLYLFQLDAEGDNYAGISMLRSCYGAWLRKQAYLKYMAIGIEKTAVPTPVGTVPEGKENSQEFARFKDILSKYSSHQCQYITKPVGWEIEFIQNGFAPEKVAQAIDMEDKAIVKSFLANFLELGIGGGSGSYSLSFDQSDFFLGGIEHIADIICEVFNDKIIPDLIKLNFGEQQEYPKLCYAGISDRAGQEFANILNTLTSSKVVVADQKLEAFVRQKYDLPEADETTKRQAPVPPTPQPFNFSEPITLAEKKKAPKPLRTSKAHDLIGDSTEELKALMQKNLSSIGQDLVKQLVTKFNTLTQSQIFKGIDQVEVRGTRAYREALIEFLTNEAYKATEQAAQETRTKFSESLDSIKFQSQRQRFEKLPKATRDRILAETALLVGTQVADIEKNLYFAYLNTAPATDSAKILQAELDDGLERYVGGPSVVVASGNTSATIVNEARNAFFFTNDVSEKIESFTSVNPDPVAEICIELQNVTVLPDDPALEQYSCPRHPNCKSVWVPNLKTTKDQPEVTGIPTLSKAAQESNTL